MVAANSIYKLAIIGTVAGQQHIHTLHFRSTVDPDTLTATEAGYMASLLALWQSGARTAYRAIFVTPDAPCQLYQVRKVCGDVPLPAGLDVAEAAGSSTATGVPDGTDFLAPWLAQVITHRSALAGRRNRGRSYLGGMEESQVNGATVGVPRTNLATTYATALTSTFVTPADVGVIAKAFVFSRTQQVEAPATPCQNCGSDVVSYQVRTQLATMKSRKAGSGI